MWFVWFNVTRIIIKQCVYRRLNWLCPLSRNSTWLAICHRKITENQGVFEGMDVWCIHQWIGLRQKLLEKTILCGKIHGFLPIFPSKTSIEFIPKLTNHPMPVPSHLKRQETASRHDLRTRWWWSHWQLGDDGAVATESPKDRHLDRDGLLGCLSWWLGLKIRDLNNWYQLILTAAHIHHIYIYTWWLIKTWKKHRIPCFFCVFFYREDGDSGIQSPLERFRGVWELHVNI